jgi:hypothetical protein
LELTIRQDLEKAMIKVGLDLGIYKVLAGADGPKTAEEVAQETGADPTLMSTPRAAILPVSIVSQLTLSDPHQGGFCGITTPSTSPARWARTNTRPPT